MSPEKEKILLDKYPEIFVVERTTNTDVKQP